MMLLILTTVIALEPTFFAIIAAAAVQRIHQRGVLIQQTFPEPPQRLQSVRCETGAQLASALSNPAAYEALLPNHVTLVDDDFRGVQTPVLLSREFTIRGIAPWPVVLNLGYTRGKVALASGSRLIFKHVIVANFRRGSVNQQPGFDALTALPPVEAGGLAALVVLDSYVVYNYCFPLRVAMEAAKRIPRAREAPGNNTWRLPAPSPYDCPNGTNGTSMTDGPLPGAGGPAPPWPLDRCLRYSGAYIDVCTYGGDLYDDGSPNYASQPYLMYLINSFGVCINVLSEECVTKLGPLGCYLYTSSSERVGAVSAGARVPVGRPPGLLAGDQPRPAERNVPVVTGAAVGGSTGVLLGIGLCVAVLVVRRRSRRGQRHAVAAASSGGGTVTLTLQRKELANSGILCGSVATDPANRGRLEDSSEAVIEDSSEATIGGRGPGSASREAGAGAGMEALPRALRTGNEGSLGLGLTRDGLLPVGRETPVENQRSSSDVLNSLAGCGADTSVGGEGSSCLEPPPAPAADPRVGQTDWFRKALAEVLTDCTPFREDLDLNVRMCEASDTPGQWKHQQQHQPREQQQHRHDRQQQEQQSVIENHNVGDRFMAQVAGNATITATEAAVVAAGGVAAVARAASEAVAAPKLPNGDGDRKQSPPVPMEGSYPASDGAGQPPGEGIVTLLPLVLGKGRFGRVFHGRYRGIDVAVKTPLPLNGFGEQTANVARRCGQDVVPLHPEKQHPEGLEGRQQQEEGPQGDQQRHHEQQYEKQAERQRDEQQWDTCSWRSFAQEVEVLGRCAHPNVVRLLAACVTPPRLCLVMELMETSLAGMIFGKDNQGGTGPLPVPTVVHIAIQVASALAYLHPTIVHRDLKPENVLLRGVTEDPTYPVAKIADFGLARLRFTAVPTSTPEAGTPGFFAPECYDVHNLIITHQADIYSLGMLMWVMLAGQRPWKNYSIVAMAFKVAVLRERPPLHCLDPQRCPSRLANLICQCWEHGPRRRPAALSELQSEVQSELLLLAK